MTWIAEVKSTDIGVYLTQLGLTPKANRWGPCPACSESSERSGRRAPLGILSNRRAVFCNACQTRMDSIDLVAHFLYGKPGRDLGRDFHGVRKWFGAPEVIAARESEPAVQVRRLPPQDELRFLLRHSTPIFKSRDQRALRYLQYVRGYSVKHTPAAVLPSPDWNGWRRIGSWWPRRWAEDFPVVVTAWTPAGELASIHGRAVDPDAKRKTTWPYDCTSKGLLFTDPTFARPMLKGRAAPDKIVICEGITDFLWACQEQVRENEEYAVLGITSGAEDGLKTVPWPDRSKIIVLTDPDLAGGRYLERVADAVAPRLVYRSPVALMRE